MLTTSINYIILDCLLEPYPFFYKIAIISQSRIRAFRIWKTVGNAVLPFDLEYREGKHSIDFSPDLRIITCKVRFWGREFLGAVGGSAPPLFIPDKIFFVLFLCFNFFHRWFPYR